MASTKEMQARAKARKQAAKANDQVCVMHADGSSSFQSFDDLRKQVQDADARGAQAIVEMSSPTNIDFTLIADPVIRTKKITVGGVNFNVNLFTDAAALAPFARKYDKEFLAMFQVWNKGGSMLLPLTRESIADAGNDWRGEAVIRPDDVLNRAIAALRLNSNNPAIHQIAMHIAYTETRPDSGKALYDGVDTLAIYRVWD